MPELGVHCQAIMNSRHVDVIEMDAASHTGIDDVREIIENARYRPVSARTKVYIIDEVHMLSKPAFNGLLKTLEEPPEHVKFLFATTEIDKVPITVRSRCMRFDLRRIDADARSTICARSARRRRRGRAGGARLIARAAEGSVRDALSLLDQAIAHGARIAAAPSRAGICATCSASPTGAGHRAVRGAMKGEIAAALALLETSTTAAPSRRNPARTGRVLPSRHAPEDRARHGATSAADARSASAARRRRAADDRGADARLADSAQGRGGAERIAASAGLGRDGADASRLCLRPADARRGAAQARLQSSAAPGERRASARSAALAGSSAGPRVSVAALAPAPSAPPRVRCASAGAAVAPPRRVALADFEAVVALAGAKRDMRLQSLEREVRLAAFRTGRIEFNSRSKAPSATGADARAAPAGMDRRALDGRCRLAGGRPTLRETAQGARGRAQQRRSRRIRLVARCLLDFQARASSACAAGSREPLWRGAEIDYEDAVGA